MVSSQVGTTSPAPHSRTLAGAVNAYVMQDEARHVSFGRLALREYYPQLSDAERDEREQFVVEALYFMRDRFNQGEVWMRSGLPVKEMLEHAFSQIEFDSHPEIDTFDRSADAMTRLIWLRVKAPRIFDQIETIYLTHHFHGHKKFLGFTVRDGDGRDFQWTPEVERATAHLYEKVRTVIPAVEWPFFAPYVLRMNSLLQSLQQTLRAEALDPAARPGDEEAFRRLALEADLAAAGYAP